MSEKSESSERPPLIGATGLGDSLIITQLARTTALTDQEILEAMAARLENGPSVVDAIAGLVAQEVLRRGLEEGAPLVTAVSPLLMRNMHGECFLADDDFARLRGVPRTELGRYVAQGDEGIHAAAGLGESRGQQRIHNEGDRKLRHGGRSIVGYERALQLAEQAERAERTLALTVKTTAPTLKDRFSDVVDVILGLLRKRTLREVLAEKQVPLIN